MRILQLIKNFDFGGAENYVCDLANALDEHGNNVYIIAGKGRQVSRLRKRVRFIPLRLNDSLILFQVIIICYVSLKNRIQVIHAHQRLPILMACIVGKITGIPVVVTVHGRTRYDLKSWISRRFSQKTIFVSSRVFEVSAKYEEIKHKSVVIPNWFSVPENRSEEKPYMISYISRIDKKHSSVILMMIQKVMYTLSSEFPMITFEIIGEGGFSSEIKEEATRLNNYLKRDACIVHGFKPDVRKVIQSSGLVMGVGRVALEAIACGIPVLSINQKRMGSIISTENYQVYKNCNFVAVKSAPPDYNRLSMCLRDFFNNPDYWHKESSLLQKMVNEDFNREKITKTISDIYVETTHALSQRG